MNQSSLDRLQRVHPALAARVAQLIATLADSGHTFEVVQGLRSYAEQNALYAQGRSRPGPIVTRARAGYSNHNFGLAVDLCPFVDGKPDWNAPLKVWALMDDEARKLGLECGGDWKKFRDLPHLQLPGMSVDECRDLFNRGGLPHVWAKMNAILKEK